MKNGKTYQQNIAKNALSAGFRFRGKRYNTYLTTKMAFSDAVCCSPTSTSQRERFNCGLFLWNNNYERNVTGSKSCPKGNKFLGVPTR